VLPYRGAWTGRKEHSRRKWVSRYARSRSEVGCVLGRASRNSYIWKLVSPPASGYPLGGIRRPQDTDLPLHGVVHAGQSLRWCLTAEKMVSGRAKQCSRLNHGGVMKMGRRIGGKDSCATPPPQPPLPSAACDDRVSGIKTGRRVGHGDNWLDRMNVNMAEHPESVECFSVQRRQSQRID
jgi:hypothetical protein